MLVIIFGIPNILGYFYKILFKFFLRTAPARIVIWVRPWVHIPYPRTSGKEGKPPNSEF